MLRRTSSYHLTMRVYKRIASSALALGLSFSLLPTGLQSAAASTYVSLFSGQGGAGEFNNPTGVTVASDGTIYIADRGNFRIKKIVDDVVSDFASTKVSITSDNDSFCSVFARGSNEVWALNCTNTKIFLFNKLGKLERTYDVQLPFISSCPSCYDWGGGIAVDSLGGIFLSDEHNHVILRIDRLSGLTTVWAGQPGVSGNRDSKNALFNIPRGLDIDSKNNLLVADQLNNSVRRISKDGVVTTVQGNLKCVIGVAVDAQDLVYAVSESYCGSIITKLGSGPIFYDSNKTVDDRVFGGIIGQPAFNTTSGIAIDKRNTESENLIYITDVKNHSIKMFTLSGIYDGKYGSEDGFGVTNTGTANQIYLHPTHTFPVDDGTYLVVDNATVRHLDRAGEIIKVTRLEKGCWYTNGAAFLPDGTFFCSQENSIVARFTDGTSVVIGDTSRGRADGNSSTARFFAVRGLAVYGNDLYAADEGNGQIRKITRVGNTRDFRVTTVLGTGDKNVAIGDVQTKSKATFVSPTRIAIDDSGVMYIVDGGIDSIFKVSLVRDTNVERIGRWIGSWPSSIVVDKNGVVYVSGFGGTIHTIERGVMSLISGSIPGNRVGTTDEALFNRPSGMSIDLDGKLVIADRDNNAIKMIAVDGTPTRAGILSQTSVEKYLQVGDSPLAAPDEDSLLTDPEKDCDPEFVLNCFAGDEDSLLVPASPEALTVTFNSKFINVEVQVPGDATRVILFSPDFGVSKAKPLVGAISSGFASFKVALNSLYAGKKGVIQLIASNGAGESVPLKIPVTAPKVVTKASPKKVTAVKPRVAPRPAKVTCIKGAIKRSFDGTKCPSGYSKG